MNKRPTLNGVMFHFYKLHLCFLSQFILPWRGEEVGDEFVSSQTPQTFLIDQKW